MGDLSRQARGRWAERQAALLLRRRGYRIYDRNWRPPDRHLAGDLDIVAGHGDVVVVVEVKARHSSAWGGAAAAVGATKQDRIRRLTASWLHHAWPRHHPDASWPSVRFDVITVEGVRFAHWPAAFE